MAGHHHHPVHGDTRARHPSRLQEQDRKQNAKDQSDLLRKMAMRNSYDTRSLGSTPALRCSTRSSTTPCTSPSHTLLPPISKNSPTLQRTKCKEKRSMSPASARYLDGRPRSSSDQLQCLGIKKDSSGTLKRSSSQSSVAMNKTTPTIQTGSSSYVYHTPSGRRIGSTNRKSYENVKLQVPPQLDQTDIKRSSSWSTVAANSTTKSCDDKVSLHCSPTRTYSETMPKGSSYHVSDWSDESAVIYPQHLELFKYSSGGKVCNAWTTNARSLGTRHSQPLIPKQIAHSNNNSPNHQLPRLSLDSSYQRSFQCPQYMPQYDKSLPITRFGSTPFSLPANGIVPNLMYGHSHSASQVTTRRVRLHTPRGKKVASLV